MDEKQSYDIDDELVKRADKYIGEHPDVEYKDAVLHVLNSDPELAEAYISGPGDENRLRFKREKQEAYDKFRKAENEIERLAKLTILEQNVDYFSALCKILRAPENQQLASDFEAYNRKCRGQD